MLDKDILISQNQDLIASLSMICGVCGVSAKSLSLVVPGDYNAVEFRICLLDEVLKLNEFFFICDECLSLVLRCTSGLSFVDHLRSLSQFEFVRGCFLCGSNNLLNKFQITYDFSSLMALIRFNLQYTFRTEVLHNICPPCEELYTDLTNLYHVIRNNPKYPGDEVAAKEKKRIPSTKKYNTCNDEMIANFRLENRSNNILQGEDTKTINDSGSVSLSTTEEQHNLKEIMEQFQQYTVSQCTTTTSTSTRNNSRIDVGWETYDTSETTTNKRSYLGESVQEGDIEETLQEKKEAVVKEEKEIEEEQEGEEKDIQEEAEERMEQGRIKKYKVEEEELRDEELNEEYEYEFDDYEEEEEHGESQSNMQSGEDDQFEELYEEEEEESHQTPEFLQSQKNKVEEIQSDIYALRDTSSEKHSNSTTDRSFTTFKNSSKNDLEHNCLKRILSKNNTEDLLMKTHPQFHTDAKSTSITEILDAHQQTKLQQDKNDLIAKQNPLYTEKNIEEEEIRNEAEKDKEVNGEYDYEFNDYEEQDEDQNKVHTEEEDEVDDLSEEKQEGHQTTDIESPQPDQNKKMQVFAILNTPSKNLLNPSTAKVNTNISYSSSSFNCKDVKKIRSKIKHTVARHVQVYKILRKK
ncbi:hypothetical protein FQR65_LT10683 [Abscondita terminalis]|nr:hypothetical protein FQR65_LT10683 [Abscondita terminalis]